MAISAASVFEVRVTGSDNNGGGYVSGGGGTDYTLQDAAAFNGTDLVIDGTTNTKVTSATHNFVAADVGNFINVTAGTNFTVGRYQIVSVASNAATLDRAAGTVGSTGGTWYEGGAIASPAIAAAVTIAGNVIYVKYSATAYAITTASAGVASGCVNMVSGVLMMGYDTNRTLVNADANRPLLQLSGTVSTTVMVGTVGAMARNIIVDGNNQTSSKGFASDAWNCKAINCTNSAFTGRAVYCEATGCSTTSVFMGTSMYCWGHGNSSRVFSGSAFFCVASESSAGGFLGAAHGCIAYNNPGGGTSGFFVNSSAALSWSNCIAIGNGQYGYAAASAASSQSKQIVNCAHYNNAGGNVFYSAVQEGTIALTADPFVDAANGDFRLNTAAGGGALLRAAGWPATFGLLNANITNYSDIGMFQHQDAASGGGGGSSVWS